MLMKKMACVLLAVVLMCLLAACGPSFAYIDLQAVPGGEDFSGKMAQSADIVRSALESNGIKGTDIVWDEKGLLSVRFGPSEPYLQIRDAVIKLVSSDHILVLKKPDGTVVCTSWDFASVSPSSDAAGDAVVAFQLKGEAVQWYAQATQELAGSGGKLQVYYDGALLSEPVVKAPVTDGSGVIAGFADQAQAADVAQKVMVHAMPLQFRVVKMVRRAME